MWIINNMKRLNLQVRYALSIVMFAFKGTIDIRKILLAAVVCILSISTGAFADKATCIESTFTHVKNSKAEVVTPRSGSEAIVEFDFNNSTLYGPSHNDVFQYKNVDIDLYKRIYLNSILMFNNDRTSMSRVYQGHNSSKITTYDCEYKRYKS